MSDIDHQLRVIKRGCDELIVEAELREKLKSGRTTALKLAGTDRARLHLGHTVVINSCASFRTGPSRSSS